MDAQIASDGWMGKAAALEDDRRAKAAGAHHDAWSPDAEGPAAGAEVSNDALGDARAVDEPGDAGAGEDTGAGAFGIRKVNAES